MSITLTALQKQRTDTAANWTSANPTLLSGELGFESDTGKAKLGNGSTAWTSLGYLGVIPSSGTYPLSQLIMPLGTAGAPPLTFVGDVNTGIYSPGADQVSVSTGGTERLRIDSTGQIEAVSLGTAAAPVITFTGDLNTGIYSPGADQVAISTGGSGRLFVDADGEVGIGTGSPDGLLTLAGANSNVPRFRIQHPSSDRDAAISTYFDGSGTYLLTGSNHYFSSAGSNAKFDATSGSSAWYLDGSGVGIFYNSSGSGSITERFRIRADGTFEIKGGGTAGSSPAFSINPSAPANSLVIDSSGRLGIGTSSPGFALDVLPATSAVVAARFRGNASTTNNTQIRFYGANAAADQWAVGNAIASDDASRNFDIYDIVANANRLRIDSSGRVGIGTQSPGTVLDIVGSGNPTLTLRGSAVNNSPILNLQAGGSGESVIDATGGSTALRLLISGTERARIDSSGRLLVGTSSASAAATSVLVQGNGSSSTAEGIIRLTRGTTTPGASDELGTIAFGDSNHNTAAYLACNRDGGTWNTSTSRPTRLSFSTTADGASSPTERMRITNAGALYHFSTASDLIACATTKGAGTTDYIFTGGYSSSGPMNFGTNSIRIYTNGNVQNTNNSYTAISDIKLKENIVDANPQWDDIKALRVRNYNLKEGQTHKQIGLIAQEVEPISPGLVYESPDRDADGNDLGTVTKSVNYSVLYMKAVKALQEAMERIEDLEARLDAANL